jgi:hypothetical protein
MIKAGKGLRLTTSNTPSGSSTDGDPRCGSDVIATSPPTEILTVDELRDQEPCNLAKDRTSNPRGYFAYSVNRRTSRYDTPDVLLTRKVSMRRKLLEVVAGVGSLAVVAVVGALLVRTGTYAASAQAQSATAFNLTITAVASSATAGALYPGGKGDVVVTISNLSPYPVTVTAVGLPTNATYATGYTTNSLTTTKAGCLSTTPSDVIWNHSTFTSESSHTLAKALTVAASGQANNPLTVTFIDDASMTAASPAACEDTYFSMPAMTGVVARNGVASITTSPAIDSWSS